MKLAFVDYWRSHNPHAGGKNWIWEQVKDVATLAHPWTADILISSNYGSAWQQHPGKPMIFHNTEPDHKTDLQQLKAAAHIFGFDPDDDTHTRLPNWLFYADETRDYTAPGHLTPAQIATRRKKILAVVTNRYCPERNAFMDTAISVELMDSMGGWKRTHPGRIISKYPACTLYQFVLAFENCSQAGYTTEKIIDAINAGAIPIHWGASQTDFNPFRLISRGDFESDAALLDHVRELTRHPDKLATIINRPAILPGQDIRPHIRERVREIILGMAG